MEKRIISNNNLLASYSRVAFAPNVPRHHSHEGHHDPNHCLSFLGHLTGTSNIIYPRCPRPASSLMVYVSVGGPIRSLDVIPVLPHSCLCVPTPSLTALRPVPSLHPEVGGFSAQASAWPGLCRPRQPISGLSIPLSIRELLMFIQCVLQGCCWHPEPGHRYENWGQTQTCPRVDRCRMN